jgi:CRISPR system Cascade subunit CasD
MSTRVLLLRFDTPLVSFGAPMVDQQGVIQPMPARSMLAGLLANALGYRHGEHDRLQRLQERVRFAARTDRAGAALVDYQVADLGQPWMDPARHGWTTRGRLMERTGASGDALHIRYRHYRADSIHTVALRLDPEDEEPTLDATAAALAEPARPLFLGRKTCLPASPILLGIIEAPSLVEVLVNVPRPARSDAGALQAWWDDGEDESASVSPSRLIPVTDERDWRNQIHVGRRLLRQGHVDPPTEQCHG